MKVRIGDKTWDKDAVHALLDRNGEAVARALMIVYGNQTADERAAFATKHHNGTGFTGADAEWLTDIAKKWLIWRRWASERQLNAVRKAIKKYHRQILEHMLETQPGAVLVTARPAPVPVDRLPTQPVYGMF
jgi:hypothetical protein